MDLPHFPDRGAWSQKDLAGDHGGTLVAVFLKNIVQNIIPFIPGKIHINIRHIHSLGMDEPLKLEIVAERVDLCDK